MRKILVILFSFIVSVAANAQEFKIYSPNEAIRVALYRPKTNSGNWSLKISYGFNFYPMSSDGEIDSQLKNLQKPVGQAINEF